MEICPEAINISHSTTCQTRHLIIRNTTLSAITICVKPPLRSPNLVLAPPDRHLLEISSRRILLRLPPAERAILRLVYTPGNKHLSEDAIVVFSDLCKKPIIVRVSCRNAEPPCRAAKVLSTLDLTYPAELNCKAKASEASCSSDSGDEAASTFLKGTGWVDDYGKLVKRPTSSTSTAQNRISKSETLNNWESLKRSYN